MVRKQFILVAGFDFINFKTDFGQLCITRALELHEKYYTQADLLFTIFDFAKGTISQMKASGESGAITAPKIIQTFRPVRISDYYLFDKGTPVNYVAKRLKGTLTATHIYDLVIEIGKTNPGELVELSFFSAANSNYAVNLVKTILPDPISKKDKLAKKAGARLTGDIDPQPYWDFRAPRMDEQTRETFRSAFSEKEGYIWVWGANEGILTSPEIYGDDFLLYNVIKDNPAYTGPGLSEDTVFVFPRLDKARYEDLKRDIEDDYETKIERTNTHIPFGYMKYQMYFDWRKLAFEFCKKLTIKSYGPIGSSYTEFEKGRTFNLMKVADKFKDYVQFFEDQYGFKHEPDRFYMEYNPDDDYDEVEFEPEDFHPPKPVVNPPTTVPQPPASIPVKPPAATQPASQPTPASVPAASQPTSVPVIPPKSNPATQASSQPAEPPKILVMEFILIAGFDFKISAPVKIDFRELCISRMKKIIAENNRGEQLHFTLFDFTSGKITSFLTNTSGELKTTVEKELGAISIDDYKTETEDDGEQVGVFQETTRRVMSMQDVFAYIIEIGKNAPGSLMELSFFCHGNEFGPQTVHFIPPEPFTFSPDPVTWKFYDPFHPFDFSSALMNKKGQENFRNAFHPQGYSWTWGYDSDTELQTLVKSIIASRDYKAGISPETIIRLKNPTPAIRRMVERLSGNDPGPRRVKYYFGFLLRQLAVLLKTSYMYHLAKNSGRPVFGGLPGVHAETESGKTHNLVRIDQSAYKKYNTFFHDNFGFGFDPEKRGYGKYIQKNEWDAVDFPGEEYEENIVP